MDTGDPELLASYWLHAGDTPPTVGREWSTWEFEARVATLAEVGFTGIGLTHTELRHRLIVIIADYFRVAPTPGSARTGKSLHESL